MKFARARARGRADGGGRVRRRVAARGKELGWLALVCLFTLILWVDFAWTIFLVFHGLHVPKLREFAAEVATTQSGLLFLIVGNGFGSLIAFLVFSITVVTPTLLVDRDIDFITAMTTSVRLVIANPFVMLVWAASIGVLLALSIATGFLGLFVVPPVLGHASWALYRRAIASGPRGACLAPRGRRIAFEPKSASKGEIPCRCPAAFLARTAAAE